MLRAPDGPAIQYPAIATEPGISVKAAKASSMGNSRPFAAVLFLAAAGFMATAAAQTGPRPQRIVSMNLCTDELLMLLVPPERIASISYLSHEPDSRPAYLAHIVEQIPPNHGLAEEVIMMEPDLVVNGMFSARPTAGLLTKLGYTVVDFAPEENFDDMRENIRLMGEITGEQERAAEVIAELDIRLAALAVDVPADAPIFADLGANNVVTGADTLTASIVHAGGYRTLGEALGFSGMRQVSLEQVILSEPDLISLGAGTTEAPAMATQNLRHPALRMLAERTQRIEIPDRMWVCGSPSALEAAELLAAAREHWQRGQAPSGQ